MPQYRLYRFDPPTSRLVPAGRLHAADDESAIRQVRNGGHDLPVELWRGGRKLRRIEHSAGAAVHRPGSLEWDRLLVRDSRLRLEASWDLLRRTAPAGSKG